MAAFLLIGSMSLGVGYNLTTGLMKGYLIEKEANAKVLVEKTKTEEILKQKQNEYNLELQKKKDAQNAIEDEKQRRLDTLMAVQQDISSEIEAEKVGQIMKVIIDRKEGEYYVGRTEYCSPEVDPEVLIKVADKKLRVGCFYDAKITSSEEFDLYGEIV